MATNSKKGKSKENADKRSAKRSEEATPSEDKREDSPKSAMESETPAEETNECESAPAVVEEVPSPPTPEPVYEEPVLTQLIVEEYDGKKEKGLYDGDGNASFKMGHAYSGQFLEGLMHGKGTYVWADGLQYEGEFNENKVTGKGIYQWPDESHYDGDVSDGLRDGFGTFTTSDGKMRYTGDWHLGKKSGKGRMDYDPEGISFYEGDWVDNIRHGWGTRCYPSGNVYQGMWFNDVRHSEGTMRWLDTDQMYTGQWENGIQHGLGQHIWFLKRVGGSQYPLRNMYDGEFNKGMREGQGTFYYANGARYEGVWKNNMKQGKGKFIFKNGRIYEGVFEKDHILEFPDFEIDGVTTPDMTQIRTRTPLPSEHMSVHSNDSHNTHSPSFQLDVDKLLENIPDADRDYEAAQVIYVIMRYITSLRKIYNYYSALGYEESLDNTHVMNRMQFWRFLKDCHLHYADTTLSEMDRALYKSRSGEEGEKEDDDMHSPYTKILFREFTNNLVMLAFHLYGESCDTNEPMLAWCMSKLITENILKQSCSVHGYIYKESRRAINALIHLDQSYDVYKAFSTCRKYKPYEPILKMRQFLFMMKDLKLINANLTPKIIIDILAKDDPKVADNQGAINLELDMTFLEFFEALIGCAEVYVTEAVVKDPSTPRASTTLTQEQSLMSLPGSPSRGASQVDDGEDEGSLANTPGVDVGSEVASPGPRSTSQMTQKTLDGSGKPSHHHTSIAPGSLMEGTSQHTAIGSAKKSEMLDQMKKSASFASTHSVGTEGATQHMVQSMVSMAQSDMAEEASDEEEDEEYEELDEETRQFNFWTHQVHIFFVRKFLPAAHRYAVLQQMIADRKKANEEAAVAAAAASKATATTETLASSSPAETMQNVNGISPETGTDSKRLRMDDLQSEQ